MQRFTGKGSLDSFLTRKLSGPIFTWHQILSLSIPCVLDSLSIMFLNMLIAALISQNGQESTTAVSLVGPITGVISCIFQGISAGGTIIVAQCCGKNDENLLKRAVGMILWMTVCIGCVTCLPFVLFPGQILDLLYPTAKAELSAAVIGKARQYLLGCVFSIMIFTVYTGAFAVLRGLGESKKCLILSVIINVAYLLFSLLFLNVLHMDIVGSCIALILARLLGALWAVALLFFWKPAVRLNIRHLFSYEPVLMRSTLKISFPFILEQICYSLGNLVSNRYMIHLGDTAIHINYITNSLIGFFTSPAMAAANVSVTVVGRCVGANNLEEARRYGKRCNQIAMILIVLACLICYPMLSTLLWLYQPAAEAESTIRQLLIASIPALVLFWPRSYTLPSTLRSGNDTMFPMAVSLSVLWGISIGLSYVLAIPCGLGVWGVWIGTWAAWAVRCLCFGLRFYSGKWLRPVRFSPSNI